MYHFHFIDEETKADELIMSFKVQCDRDILARGHPAAEPLLLSEVIMCCRKYCGSLDGKSEGRLEAGGPVKPSKGKLNSSELARMLQEMGEESGCHSAAVCLCSVCEAQSR